MPEVDLLDARLAAAGKAFVLVSGSGKALDVEACEVFRAVSKTVEERGGWLIEDGVQGARETGFARLMEARAAGDLAWEKACPLRPGQARRSRIEMKLPHTMLVHTEMPCWALRGRLYSLDLFNAANELMLPYDDARRMWQLVPWLPRFHWMGGEAIPSSFEDFLALIKALAECVDCAGGFGGVGLPQAVYAYNLPEGSDHPNLKKPSEGVRLTDMSYPYMVLRTHELPAGLADRLLRETFRPGSGAKQQPFCPRELFGGGKFLLVGVARPPEGYPTGDDDMGILLGQLLDKPYAVAAVVRSST